MFKGFQGLLQSKKATMSMLILGCATSAVMFGKIDGVSYSAIIGTIAVIYNFVAMKTDVMLGKNNE